MELRIARCPKSLNIPTALVIMDMEKAVPVKPNTVEKQTLLSNSNYQISLPIMILCEAYALITSVQDIQVYYSHKCYKTLFWAKRFKQEGCWHPTVNVSLIQLPGMQNGVG